jgi:hypothetical protein
MMRSRTFLLSWATLPWVMAQMQGQRLATHGFFLSHLSPLLSYTPSNPTNVSGTGWNPTLSRTKTTDSSAKVEFSYFGHDFDLWGNWSSLEGIERGLNDDWHKTIVGIDGSNESFMDIKFYTASSDVPATL